MRAWWRRRRRQRRCFHHETRYSLMNAQHMTGEQVTFIVVEGHVDGGRRAFRCSEAKGGCGKLWLL